MELSFESIAESEPGPRWLAKFHELWPHYRRWYLAEGHSARPTYLACERALKKHLPLFVPTWERLVELAGGGDVEARFLSLYRPPPYLSGCSQAVWIDDEPLLVRNYDYSPMMCDKLLYHTRWNERGVIAMTDCMVGVLDGVNDSGLAVSLNFGGMQEVGDGFGAPLILRYILEFCSTTAEAVSVLRNTPIHMAYNFLIVDRSGQFVTAFSTPDGPTLIRRVAASTNHQDRIAWPRHAKATATLERERRLYELLADRGIDAQSFTAAFLQPPLRQSQYDRGYGTLYTAVYRPCQGTAEYLWPNAYWKQSFQTFEDGMNTVSIATIPDGLAPEGLSPTDLLNHGISL